MGGIYGHVRVKNHSTTACTYLPWTECLLEEVSRQFLSMGVADEYGRECLMGMMKSERIILESVKVLSGYVPSLYGVGGIIPVMCPFGWNVVRTKYEDTYEIFCNSIPIRILI